MPKKNPITKTGLTAQQEEFCKLYATDLEYFGNGVTAYIAAYIAKGKKKGTGLTYNAAKSNAYRLLTNADILKRIDHYQDLYGNDQVVDKELAFVIMQKADFSSKVAAIREYNNLKRRTKAGITNQFNFISLPPEEIARINAIKAEGED